MVLRPAIPALRYVARMLDVVPLRTNASLVVPVIEILVELYRVSPFRDKLVSLDTGKESVVLRIEITKLCVN
jgi:hypothetical protein